MDSPRYVLSQQPPISPLQHTHYTPYDQYGSDRLHPNHTHRRDLSASSNGSFSTYQLQRTLPSINTSVATQDFTPRSGSIASAVSPYAQRHYSVSSSYQQDPYVATLRKQKATVWCERAQAEDPRIMAAQRAAKARATMEVTGSSFIQDINNHGFGGSSSNSPASSLYGGTPGHGATPSLTLASSKPNKILAGVGGGVHTVRKKAWVKDRSGSSHGSGKKIIMDPGSLIVGAVPTRLSASEVMGDSSEEDGETSMRHNRRAPRTSINSTHRQSTKEYERSRRSSEGLRHTNSTGSKSSMGSSTYSAPRSIAEEEEPTTTTTTAATAITATNLPTHSHGPISDYYPQNVPGTNSGGGRQPAECYRNPPHIRRATSGSASTTSSSGSVRDGLGPLPAGLVVEKVRTPAAELRRRGSVDEREARTRTMSGVRLFVANPDAN